MAGIPKADIAKERILYEAEALFAERGFYAVTVREITRAARCNLAAVNYYFGNKQNLYMEVFRCLWKPRAKRVLARFEKLLEAQREGSLKGIVHAIAEAFIKGPLSEEERLRHSQLMIREMARPTEAFEMVIGDVIGPFQQKLVELIRPFMAREMGRVALLLHIQSIISMVIHFNFARNPVMRITGMEYDDQFTDELVEHVVQFSLNGLSGAGKGGPA
ncbi:MAG: CerR family C-terminal domain-containing protein [Deltaproteobacteria bacterium]|nr:CerR family C-terminal domain-containing protein [Deltaproteobacteria bacterium]